MLRCFFLSALSLFLILPNSAYDQEVRESLRELDVSGRI